LFSLVFFQRLAFIPAIIVGWIIAHTINFLLNGQAMAILTHFGYIKNQEDEVEQYIDLLKDRLQSETSLRWAAIYGSLSRGEMRETSDLDVRVIRTPGFINGSKACFFVMGERTRALLKGFPLDILLLDSPRLLKRMRPDEPPFVIYDASTEHCAIE
jgi:predicted nucleotidyltransferase